MYSREMEKGGNLFYQILVLELPHQTHDTQWGGSGSYSTAEMQLVNSTASANRVITNSISFLSSQSVIMKIIFSFKKIVSIIAM